MGKWRKKSNQTSKREAVSLQVITGHYRSLQVITGHYSEVNGNVFECLPRSKNFPGTVTAGPLLKERALMFEKELGHNNFTAIIGWLEAFNKE